MTRLTTYRFFQRLSRWQESVAKTITFILTEDCQLRCRYCYICGKNSTEKLTFEVARQSADYILSDRENYATDSVIWEFIGGEPFLEVVLMDKICDYIKVRMYELDHPWFENYRISLSTNGLLYDDPQVQKFIQKNAAHISVGISIDGTKEKHNLQRIFPDGSGSYDAVARNVSLWQEQFGSSHTKATIAHEDLRMVKDSVLHLWDIGIKEVAMNCVFENVWREGDDNIFEQQLVELADVVIEKELYKEYKTTLFDRFIGFYMNPETDSNNWCGAGKMLAIDTQGNFHPCIRFVKYSLENKSGLIVGNTQTGIDTNKLRPFLSLSRTAQSSRKCIECEVASGCAWCQGYNYDTADTDTIFQRATYICKMHKARVRANNYLWNKLDKIVPPPEGDRRDYKLQVCRKGLQALFVIVDNDAPSFCYYKTTAAQVLPLTRMSVETLRKVVYYALTNNLSLNVLVGRRALSEEFKAVLKECNYILLRPLDAVETQDGAIDVFDYEVDTWQDFYTGSSLLLRLNREHLGELPMWLEKHSLQYDRISFVIKDMDTANAQDFVDYQATLKMIADWLPEREEQKPLELAFLTDRLILTEPNHCEAGLKHLTIVPEGGVYLCPGFYYQDETAITDIDSVLKTHEMPIKNKQLLQLDHAPICEKCDAYHCKRCIYLNKKTTLEYNTPSKQQCVYAHLERNTSATLIEPLFLADEVTIPAIDYLDPFDELQKRERPKGEKADEW